MPVLQLFPLDALPPWVVSFCYHQNSPFIPPHFLFRSVLQAVCDPATNCRPPCWACNTQSDTCEPVAGEARCATDGGAAGHCVAGVCQVRGLFSQR